MTATTGTCSKADCTAAVTGRCLEAHPTLEACPHFTARTTGTPSREVSSPVTQTVPRTDARGARQFHAGLELGLEDALAVTRVRYGHLVGLLGPSNAGKTCFLTSLYLQACHGMLSPDFRFAGSLTLQGFELRARKLRTWTKSSLPEQLADHTVLADPRKPAFMHLALDRPAQPGERVELLISDLPGEWSSELINRADAAKRFEFLERADAVVVVVEGPRISKKTSRHVEVMNVKLLLQRLAESVKVDPQVPLVLLVSKCDELDMRLPAGLAEVEEQARTLGFRPVTVATASFSRKPDRVPNGKGVLEVIQVIVAQEPDRAMPAALAQVARPGRAYWHVPTQ